MTGSASLRIAAATGAIPLLFVLGSQFMLPFARRGLNGGGLYEFVDEWRFYEVALLSFLGMAIVSAALRLSGRAKLALLVAGPVINVALLMLDIRIHKYSSFVETYIADSYGTPIIVWSYVVGLLALGGLCVAQGLRWEKKS